jgi:MFS family permease
MNAHLHDQIGRARLIALAIGIAAGVVTVIGAFSNTKQFFYSYLFGFLFWTGLSLGCLAVTMMHHLTGGRWGWPTRRFLEAGFMVLPLMAVLFIPIFFGLRHLYPWAQPSELSTDKILSDRHAYQNSLWYIVRQIFFFIVFIFIAARLRACSLRQDETADAQPTRTARTISGPGLVLYGLLTTFVAMDWIMSIEAHWYSTMFGVIICISQIVSAYAFSVVMIAAFRRDTELATALTKTQYHQLGNLLLAFVLFWTYVSFGEFLIIYSGDLPHELEWYIHRIAGNWKLVLAAIAALHFFIPFFLLLFRAMKKNATPLTILAGMLFVMRIVHMYWLVMPAFHRDNLAVSWMDFTAPLAIGGLWFVFFLSRLRAAPLLPRRDPGLQFAFVYVEP